MKNRGRNNHTTTKETGMMSLSYLIRLCRKFADLGDTVGEQIERAIRGQITDENWNPNVKRYLKEFLDEATDGLCADLLEDRLFKEQCDQVLEYVERRERELSDEGEER
jgi:hypothetical protein